MAEQLIRNEQVVSSILTTSSKAGVSLPYFIAKFIFSLHILKKIVLLCC